MSATLHGGWHLLGLEDEIAEGLTPLRCGDRRLMLVREGDEVRLSDSTCPHRGADLARGGVLKDGCVICPFHGRRIHLGTGGRHTVLEHSVLRVGPLVLGRLGQRAADDRGLSEHLPAVLDGSTVISAVQARVSAHPELVVENAFDPEHFATVHRVPEVRGMTARRNDADALVIGGDFFTVLDPWSDPVLRARVQHTLGPGVSRVAGRGNGFMATAYSPTLVVTRVGSGADAPVIITGALPDGSGGSQVRVVVAGSAPANALERVAAGSRKAIREDTVVWDNLDPNHVDQLDDLDGAVRAFQQFCRSFEQVALGAQTTTIGVASEAG